MRADRPTRTTASSTTPATPTFYNQLAYWTTPTAKCLDGRTDVTCKNYADWTAGVGRDQGLTTNADVASREPPVVSAGGSRALYQRPRLRLGLLLAGPLAWLLVAYIGALVALLLTSLYHYQTDPTGLVQKLTTSPSTTNYPPALDQPVYRDVVVVRTIRRGGRRSR